MNAVALVIAFFLAMALETLPSGPVYGMIHPDFVALLLLYWSIRSGSELSYTVVWLIGLLQDMVMGNVPGGQAVADVLMIYALVNGLVRVRHLSVWEQLVFIFMLLFAHRLIVWSWQLWSGPVSWHFSLLLSPLMGALLWPLFTYLLDYLRHHLLASP
ncbi:rod shape-determining protein MreD [Acidithiobacillus thiooxidans]|uniref:rod shape-determining protein MreD n=1 Tax=Acidithiobacillus thiooxidans TaxID=930 RepID=UPI0035650AB5